MRSRRDRRYSTENVLGLEDRICAQLPAKYVMHFVLAIKSMHRNRYDVLYSSDNQYCRKFLHYECCYLFIINACSRHVHELN